MRQQYLHIPLCLLTYVLLVACSGCNLNCLSAVYRKHTALNTVIAASVEVTASSDINSNRFRHWSATRLNLEPRTGILQFSTSQLGWAGSGERFFYKTENGGETWSRVNVEGPSPSHIASIFFVNESLGWVVLQHYAANYLDFQDTKVWLLITTDGGQSWQSQYQGNTLNITRIVFANQQEGWVVGDRTVKKETIQSECLLLHTMDGGKHWADLSNVLNSFIADCQGGVHDSVNDVKIVEPGKIALLTNKGHILSTDDGGYSWRQIADIDSDVMLARIICTQNNHLGIVGGRDGNHGIKGEFLQQNDGIWMRYVTGNICFQDAVYLSEGEILACGSILPEKLSMPPGRKREGVILYSADGGRNWIIVYRNAEAQSINALAIIDHNHIWALGEEGLLLRLEPTSENVSSPTSK